jgi:hypothetical protein
MPERKTTTLALPSGGSVEIKEYISAGEFLDATDAKDDLPKSELAKKLIQLALVSVNGKTENIGDELRALPLQDYLVISKEVAKLTSADFTQAKEPSQKA